ncbi:hypothetical protein CIB48_g10497 [Xylaria polymorpha]|nr:hypothetical protein CIB48_g10497 [Xylaria polymorpha]
MSAAQKPIRLPPLKTLRVRTPNGKPERPCVAIMSSVLSCWASAGYSTSGCAQLEQALRACMDGPPPRAAAQERGQLPPVPIQGQAHIPGEEEEVIEVKTREDYILHKRVGTMGTVDSPCENMGHRGTSKYKHTREDIVNLGTV